MVIRSFRIDLFLLVGAAVAALAGAALATHASLTLGALALVLLCGVCAVRPESVLLLTVLGAAIPTSGWGVHFGHPRTRLLVLLIVGIAGLAGARPGRESTAPPRPVRLWLALALTLLGIEAVWFSFPRPAVQRLFEIALAVVTATVTFLVGRSHPTRVWRVVGAVVILMAGEAALGLLQLAANSPVFMRSVMTPSSYEEATNIAGYFRGIGTFYHPNSLALALAMSLPLSVAKIQTAPRSRIFYTVLLGVICCGVLASLSRAGLICLCVATVFWLLLNRCRIAVALRTALLIGAFFVAVATVPSLSHGLSRFTSPNAATRDSGSDIARTANMSAAFRVFKEHPLAGVGLGDGAADSASHGGYTGMGAHNGVLDVMEGGGILLLTLLLGTLYSLRKSVGYGWSVRSPLTLIVPVVGTYIWFESVFQGLFVLLIGITFGLLESEAASEMPRGGRRFASFS